MSWCELWNWIQSTCTTWCIVFSKFFWSRTVVFYFGKCVSYLTWGCRKTMDSYGNTRKAEMCDEYVKCVLCYIMWHLSFVIFTSCLDLQSDFLIIVNPSCPISDVILTAMVVDVLYFAVFFLLCSFIFNNLDICGGRLIVFWHFTEWVSSLFSLLSAWD